MMKKYRNLEKGIGLNILIALAALVLTLALDGPKIDITFNAGLAVSIIFGILFLAVIIFSIIYSRPRRTKEGIADSGALKHVRYPVYSAIVFLLNPAMAILARSWIYLFACVLLYFIWRKFAKDEDRRLTKELGKTHTHYRLNSSLLFPNLFNINKTLFFASVGILVFILVFIGLNFNSLAFRYVAWGADKSPLSAIQYPKNADGQTQPSVSPANNEDKASKTPSNLPLKKEGISTSKSNAIIIEKISVSAPLVAAQSTETGPLNSALNQGAVIYPGSVMPGQVGNFFVTAHSSVYPWNRTPYGKIFAKLDKLEIGDRVTIDYSGREYVYEITKKIVLAPKDVRLFGTNEKIITLMTCWPIGTDLKRLVLEGKLVE